MVSSDVAGWSHGWSRHGLLGCFIGRSAVLSAFDAGSVGGHHGRLVGVVGLFGVSDLLAVSHCVGCLFIVIVCGCMGGRWCWGVKTWRVCRLAGRRVCLFVCVWVVGWLVGWSGCGLSRLAFRCVVDCVVGVLCARFDKLECLVVDIAPGVRFGRVCGSAVAGCICLCGWLVGWVLC